jgi:TPR repeat protein
MICFTQLYRDGINNFGQCLESGKGIGQNFIRATKYDLRSAESRDADAQNNFGICV